MNDYRDRMLEQKTLAELGTISTEMVQKLSQPVSSIKASLLTALVALRKTTNNLNLRELLETGLYQSSMAMEIIDKFFSFANIAPNPTAEPIDIEKVINQILAVFSDRIHRATLRVETVGIDAVPCMFISSHELEQIFFTIIQNVVQAVDGKEFGVFSIECSVGDEMLELAFSDNFDSIPCDDPNDIFESFSTSDATPSPNTFGLVVLKRLVLAYNGSINARRKDGVVTVDIKLPVEKL